MDSRKWLSHQSIDFHPTLITELLFCASGKGWRAALHFRGDGDRAGAILANTPDREVMVVG
jgi:hypothetical protein